METLSPHWIFDIPNDTNFFSNLIQHNQLPYSIKSSRTPRHSSHTKMYKWMFQAWSDTLRLHASALTNLANGCFKNALHLSDRPHHHHHFHMMTHRYPDKPCAMGDLIPSSTSSLTFTAILRCTRGNVSTAPYSHLTKIVVIELCYRKNFNLKFKIASLLFLRSRRLKEILRWAVRLRSGKKETKTKTKPKT